MATKKRERKFYSRVQKAEIARKAQAAVDGGMPITQACKEVGVSISSVRRWIEQYLGESPSESPSEAQASSKGRRSKSMNDNARLRAENENLRRQRDLLTELCGLLTKAQASEE